jgi:hypothetical protein
MNSVHLYIESPDQVLLARNSPYYGTRFLKKEVEEFIIEEACMFRQAG